MYSQNVFDDRHRRTCRQWNSGCVFGMAQNFGASPEYSQRTSPDRITTTLILADYLDGFADNPVEKTGKTVEKSKGLIRRVGPDKGWHWEVISKNFD